MVKFRTFQTEYQRSPHIKTLICYVTGRRDNMLFRTYTKLKYIHIRMSGIEDECLNDFTWYLFPRWLFQTYLLRGRASICNTVSLGAVTVE